MATVVADIIYKATEKGMDNVKKKLDGIDKSANNTESSVGGMSMAMKAAIPLAMIAAAAKLTGVLSDMGKEAAIAGDAIVKTSQKLGISTDALQEYRFAAEEAGIKQATLEMGLQRFSRRLGEAQMGTGELKKGLEALNISIVDSEGKTRKNTDVFEEYMQKLDGVTDASLKLALTTKAFDSEGAVFVNMAGNLEKSKQKMYEMGIIVDNSILQKLAKVNNNLGVMNKQQEVLGIEIGSAFTGITEIIGEWKVSILEVVRDVLRMIGLLDESEAELFVKVTRYEAERKKLVENRTAAEIAGLDDLASKYDKQIAAFDKGHATEIARYEEIKKARENAYTADYNSDMFKGHMTDDIGGEYDVEAFRKKQLDEANKAYDALAALRKKQLDEANKAYDALAARGKSEIGSIQSRMEEMLISNHTEEVDRIDARFLYEMDKLDEELENFKGTQDQKLEYEQYIDEIRNQMTIKQVADHKKAEEDKLQATKDSLEESKKDMIDWNEVSMDGLEDLSGAFIDTALSGEKSFGEMAASIIADIAEMIIKQMLFNAIKQGIGSFGGATFDSPTAVAGGSLGTVPGSTQTSMLADQQFAKGSVFTNNIYKQPTKFAFGGGIGMMGEENPEAIMPLSRGADGKLGVNTSGGSSNNNTTINIHNNGNSEVTTQSSTNSNGEKSIDVMIEEKINASIQNGSLDKRMSSVFGVKRRGY